MASFNVCGQLPGGEPFLLAGDIFGRIDFLERKGEAVKIGSRSTDASEELVDSSESDSRVEQESAEPARDDGNAVSTELSDGVRSKSHFCRHRLRKARPGLVGGEQAGDVIDLQSVAALLRVVKRVSHRSSLACFSSACLARSICSSRSGNTKCSLTCGNLFNNALSGLAPMLRQSQNSVATTVHMRLLFKPMHAISPMTQPAPSDVIF
jgi:hypothetical protein